MQALGCAGQIRMHTPRLIALCLAVGAASISAGVRPSAGAATPPTESPQLIAALERLQSGDSAGAVPMLEAVTRHEPRSAEAWRALSTGYRQLKSVDQAIAASEQALKVEPGAAQSFYALGVLYAAKGDADQAFMWLGRARDTHRYDMTQLSEHAELKDLRNDPRYAELLPKSADFEHPFVEAVK